MYHIGGHTFELIKDHKNAWSVDAFRDRYSDVLDRYDYIVGDWGYNQLRLKGFLKEANAKNHKEHSIALLHDYLNEYCNFGCAYFIVEKLPLTKEQLDAELERPQREGLIAQKLDAAGTTAASPGSAAAEIPQDSPAAKAALKDYREGRGFLDQREGRYSREPREPREPKEPRYTREPKDMKEPREASGARGPQREGRERDTREHREPREQRDNREHRENRENREGRAHVSSTPYPRKDNRPHGQNQGHGQGQQREGRPSGSPSGQGRSQGQGQGQAPGRDQRPHSQHPQQPAKDRNRDRDAKGPREQREQGYNKQSREGKEPHRESGHREHREQQGQRSGGSKPFHKNQKDRDRGRDKEKTEPAV